MEYDIVIVGGGPAGTFAARLLAEKGFKVIILEEHEQVGVPVQCAGLISMRTMRLAGGSSKLVLNRLTGMRIFSSLGNYFSINTDQVHALAIDRAAFDQEMAEHAQAAGAHLLLGTRVNGLERIEGGYQVFAKTKGVTAKFTARLLIGADGANSRVAKWLGLSDKVPRAIMYAADVKLQPTSKDMIDVFLGNNVAPGWFGWIIPIDGNICRVGTGYAFEHPGCSPKVLMENLVSLFPKYFSGMEVVRYTGGSVPLRAMGKIYASHAMLVGDAGGQTKPISGGGIYLGLRGAQLCAQVAARALQINDLSDDFLAHYQLLWEKQYGEELFCDYSHRKNYMNFNDKDIDVLIRFLRKPYWKNKILKYGDIDYPSRLAHQLYSAGPWVQKFMKVTAGVTNTGLCIKEGIKTLLPYNRT